MDTTDTKDTTPAGTGDTISFTLRLPVELAVRLDVLAARERKSRQRWIEEALLLVAETVEARDA